jgi:hypothetical protein
MAILVAKLGFFLELFKQQFGVDEGTLKILERKNLVVSITWSEANVSLELLKRWNLVVPTYILDHSWDEPNEDI